MSTFYVKKDGSGTHTEINSAIYDATNGDIINVGPGTFSENVEFMGKSLTLQGAGRDVTIIQGKLANDTLTGSWFAGDTVINTISTAALRRGKSLTGTNITSGSRIDAILSGTQFRLSTATATTGNYSKVAATLVNGSSTIVLPSTTSVAVGHKVEGVGVSATITAWASATKTITLSSPVTQGGTNVTLSFRLPRTNVNLIQQTQAVGSSVPASIMLVGLSNGLQIKDLTAIGFDGVTGQEAAALGYSATVSPGHVNFLIKNCRFTANGDAAVIGGPNPYMSGCIIEDCIFDGKTFTGSEPADVPQFSSFTTSGVVKSIGASSSTIEFSDMRGIVVGVSMASSGAWASNGSVTAVSGNVVTVNKVATVALESVIPVTVSQVQYNVPNVARSLVYWGQNTTPNNNVGMIFRNNQLLGQTGAVISATGGKGMFNSALTFESLNGLCENNVIDGIFGAGDPNTTVSNYAIRSRQSGTVVQNNVNKVTGGRGNSGFYVVSGLDINNITVNSALIVPVQPVAGQALNVTMDKESLKGISKVSSSAVFSNEANWGLVTYVYKQVGGSKRLTCSFRDPSAEVKMKLKYGVLSGMQFQLVKVIVAKPDRTLLVIKRSEIDGASSLDFTLA